MKKKDTAGTGCFLFFYKKISEMRQWTGVCLRRFRFVCGELDLFAQHQFQLFQIICPTQPTPQYEKALADAKASLKPWSFSRREKHPLLLW
ncbi:MAG TPA: hypothetical protein VK945_07960 [Planococcus sp. (in: firmicutes)]|nr:hypothetical protein [Planococcus sp. (in: firmicutes)]